MSIIDRTKPTVGELRASSNKEAFDRFHAEFSKVLARFEEAIRLVTEKQVDNDPSQHQV